MKKRRWLDSELNRMMLPTDIAMVALPLLAALLFCVSTWAEFRLLRRQEREHPAAENRIPAVRLKD